MADFGLVYGGLMVQPPLTTTQSPPPAPPQKSGGGSAASLAPIAAMLSDRRSKVNIKGVDPELIERALAAYSKRKK